MGDHPVEGGMLQCRESKPAQYPKQEYQWLQKWLCAGPRQGTAIAATKNLGSCHFDLICNKIYSEIDNLLTFEMEMELHIDCFLPLMK